ncbi:hypothetical protein QZH45_04410 [Pseudomonas corrugata]|uniref:Uncharacterized protein n=1 Tax=Pseudomonas corrugata TaxID=47879 RepID=A0A8B6USY6_9PSED|nr:hypothetical protein [Pseudomonas corrugata]QTH15013.1 hypothetical protein C4C32_03640 [Pseudomonas corrugata]
MVYLTGRRLGVGCRGTWCKKQKDGTQLSGVGTVGLWEQSLLAIQTSQSATALAGLPLSRASFAPTGMKVLQWIFMAAASQCPSATLLVQARKLFSKHLKIAP